MKVFVVTDSEGSWDNVDGVFDNEIKAYLFVLEMSSIIYAGELKAELIWPLICESKFVIHEKNVR
jgi:hypothetical protein